LIVQPNETQLYNLNSLSLFLGSTEREILGAIEDIVEKSLPSSKLAAHFQDTEAAKLCILNKISFCEARQKVIFWQ